MGGTLRQQINKSGGFDAPEEEAMLNIARTAAQIGGIERAFFKRYELTPAAYNLLRILRGHRRRERSAGVRASEIGGQMVVRTPDVTRLVDRLEARGLVERSDCASDRRVRYVRISDRGMRLLRRIDPALPELWRSALGHMGADELQTLSRLLEKAREAHEESEGDRDADRGCVPLGVRAHGGDRAIGGPRDGVRRGCERGADAC